MKLTHPSPVTRGLDPRGSIFFAPGWIAGKKVPILPGNDGWMNISGTRSRGTYISLGGLTEGACGDAESVRGVVLCGERRAFGSAKIAS